MMSAKAMSAAIRMKRKKVQEDGVSNMVDTAAAPQMNPQDILLNKQTAHYREVMGTPEKNEAPNDPADERVEGTSQDMAALKKQMARIKKILGHLSVG